MVPVRQLGTKGTQCGAKRGHPGARKAAWNQGSQCGGKRGHPGARRAAWNQGYTVWC